jgi:hypothetical protein
MNDRETVDRLIRLALDPGASEHEARNAAMQAVRLIDEHKFLDLASAPKKKTIPFELTAFDVQSMIQKLYVMDFDGAIAMIQRFKKRTEKIKNDRVRNLERDFSDEPHWTEKTQHAARRAGRTEQCILCGGPILMLMWIVNPNRRDLTVHLRCFRERQGANG